MRIYGQPVSTVMVEMAAFVVLWGVLGRIGKHKTCWKWFNGLVFLGSVGAILYATVFSRSTGTQVPVRMLFTTVEDAKIQPEFYRSMLMNVLLFQPIGLSLPHILPEKAHPVAATILFALLLSIGVETTQHLFRLGCSEMDDVMMNTLGAAFGSGAKLLSRGQERPLRDKVKKRL